MEVKVTFNYLDRTIKALCKGQDKMDDMFSKFVTKLNDDSKVDHYLYYYEGKKLGHDSTIVENKHIAHKADINISVHKKLRIIKCPTCKCNDCIINLDNYLAHFYGCKKGHTSTSVYDNYINIQRIDSSEIKCNEPGCKNNQENYILGFYKCLKCSTLAKRSRYYCKDHESTHDKAHVRVKYDKKNYYCEKHFKKYTKYCFAHKENLCDDCKNCEKNKKLEVVHSNCKIHSYESMTPDVVKLKESLQAMETTIHDLQYIIDDIKDRLDGALRIFKRYVYIGKDIIGKFELFNKDLKNHRILKSLWNLQFSNNKMIDELNKIIDEDNIITKTEFLISLYEKKEENYNQNINDKIDYNKENDDWLNEIENFKKNTSKTKDNGNEKITDSKRKPNPPTKK